MSIFVLKIIACISMILDHIKYVLPVTQNFATIYLGRIAFPLFAFIATEGYIHTKDYKKYIKRLFIFALISQIPFMLFRTFVANYMVLNIMFTIILGLLSIEIYEKLENKFVALMLGLIIAVIGRIIHVDYGWYGILSILFFYIFRENKFLLSIIFTTLNIVYLALNIGIYNLAVLYYFIFMTVPLVFIWLYNGKLGLKLKYFFYIFYPAHMLIFYIIGSII